MSGTNTLTQAEAARTKHSDELARLGAHAVGVEQSDDGWAVVAHVEPGQTFAAPATLSINVRGRAVDVPLKVARTPIAEAE